MSEHSNFKAALWMSGWLSLMLMMAIAGRETTRELDVFQVMVLRSGIGLCLLLPLVFRAGGVRAMATGHIRKHIARNVAHYGAQFCWLFALTLIPIAHVVSIEFTMPIWTAILAVLFLGERMNSWKIAAVVIGLAGVAIIVRPGLGSVSMTGQLIALMASFGFAIAVTMVKSLTRTESVTAIIFWMLVIQTVLGIVPAIMVWQWPSIAVWPWVVAVAICGTFSHFCMAKAMTHADATVVVPMDFLRVPLSATAGWLIYSEGIDALTVLGTALILAANMLNLRRAGTARIPSERPVVDSGKS